MLPTKFRVKWPFSSGEEAKNRFSRWLSWRPSWISDTDDFSCVWSTGHLDASYLVLSICLSVQEKKWKIDFQDGRPSWISNRNDFSHFWSISHPDASYQVSSQLVFGFRSRSEKKDFQDGHHGGHLGFPISWILAIFVLQVTLILPTKFGVNWPFGSGNEVKNWFSRWRPWQPSWISDRNDFSYFWSTSHSDASYQVLSQLAFGLIRRSEKMIFKMAAMAAILDLRLTQF